MSADAARSVHVEGPAGGNKRPGTGTAHWAARSAIYLLMAAAFLVTVVPMIWIALSSLRESSAIAATPLGLPVPPDWSNYVLAWRDGKVGIAFRNSVVITVCATLLVVSVCTLAGYALGRLRFAGRDIVFILFMLGLMIPFEAMLVPFYFRMRSYGLLNNPSAVILSFTAFTIPVGVFVMRTFFADIPQEIEDATRVDGSNEFQLFGRVMLPMAMPGVVSLSILSSVWSWNDFVRPFIFLTREEARTLPLAVVLYEGDYGLIDLGGVFASAVISFLPILLAYVLLQRQFLQGITSGAVKG